VERAATALVRRDRDLAAVLLQHARRRLIQSRETHVGDAPREERHAMPPASLRGGRLADVAEEERRLG